MPRDDRVRAVVIDDEPLARQSLRTLIGATPWMVCIGEAGDGAEGFELVRRERPELTFLDVRMPGLSGIELARRIEQNIAVIFTTAHDDYAVSAFELGAIDYLRKPFGQARFQTAVDRARERIRGSRDGAASLRERMAFALELPSPLDRLFVRVRGTVVPLNVSWITRIEADDDYVALYAHGRRYLLYMKLGELAARLDPRQFVRVHRSHIVNLEYVGSVSSLGGGRLEICMRDGSRVLASQSGSRLLRSRFK
jgi:two-component system LytT family response regulator